jgi:hypothetical protein
MTEPEFSPLPTCEKCRREVPCVRVETAFGDRSLCVADCWRLFLVMRSDLKRRVRDLLEEHDADFFDEPTRPDIPTLLPPDDVKTPKEGK